jgi:hypothetical protein
VNGRNAAELHNLKIVKIANLKVVNSGGNLPNMEIIFHQ